MKRCRTAGIIFVLSSFFSLNAVAQLSGGLLLSDPPKREFRAAWIASVVNLDWPTSPNLDPQTQRNQLTAMLDVLKSVGITSVFFQIRPECDALYASTIEPWSHWLTGQQGVAPSPFYDPLQFAVDEARKRGMELHAWFNPYRSVRSIGAYTVSANHVSVLHPEWNITIGSFKFLDPGLPQVRDYINRVVMDVVRRYDIDGVHFDDYFYPYPPGQITNQDDSTFARYPRGFTNRGDWRRDNVNIMIKAANDSIKATKPHVKFGISPFGIWKNGVPPGITGMDAYSVIYADAMAWLRAGSTDYLTPQLYWKITGSQDYSRLMPWWADSTNHYGRHLYTGNIFGTTYSPSELPNQLRLNRGNPKTGGTVFFRAGFFSTNSQGINDTLRNDFYRYPALQPVMRWGDTIPPYMPRNIRYDDLPNNGPAAIQWDLPIVAPDGDTASRYVVYKFASSPIIPQQLDSAKNILNIEGRRYSTPPVPSAGPGIVYYLVTALDRNYNESLTSSVLMISSPSIPVLAYPANGAVNQPSPLTLGWRKNPMTAQYHLQVSSDSTFAGSFIVNDSTIADTFKTVTGLGGQLKYFWRVKARNAGGTGLFTSAWNFLPGFPAAPALLYPANFATDIPENPNLVWYATAGANSYRLQVARSFDFTNIVVDSSGLADTTFTGLQTLSNTVYFWRLNATNPMGTSAWSDIWRFRTVVTTIAQTSNVPGEFVLHQNYPNPFNPFTTIAFSLPAQQSVTLTIYDLLGREVERLIDDEMSPGEYRVTFDASALASGVYLYRMITGRFVATHKMQVVK